jgi:hypothetical protein
MPDTAITADGRVRLRKSLLQLASLLMLTLITIMLLALFTVWSLDRAHQRAEQKQDQLVAALDASRQAQVHFKVQVQEWKNLLLRGEAPLRRVSYYEAFSGEEQRVDAELRQLQGLLDALELTDYGRRVEQMREEHASLGERYRTALANASGGQWNTFAIDTAVKGIDRPLNSSIDALAIELMAETQRRNMLERIQLKKRYDTLNRALWISMTAALGLIGALLWRTLRSRTLGG